MCPITEPVVLIIEILKEITVLLNYPKTNKQGVEVTLSRKCRRKNESILLDNNAKMLSPNLALVQRLHKMLN
jgi:hypothetical protein